MVALFRQSNVLASASSEFPPSKQSFFLLPYIYTYIFSNSLDGGISRPNPCIYPAPICNHKGFFYMVIWAIIESRVAKLTLHSFEALLYYLLTTDRFGAGQGFFHIFPTRERWEGSPRPPPPPNTWASELHTFLPDFE